MAAVFQQAQRGAAMILALLLVMPLHAQVEGQATNTGQDRGFVLKTE